MQTVPKILLVDDDRYLAESMAIWLGEQGFSVDVSDTMNLAQQLLAQERYDLLIIDLRLEDGDGMELIQWVRKQRITSPVLALTGYGTPQTAIEVVRAGAFDLLTKPLIDDELMLAIDRAMAHREIEEENAQLKQQLDRRFGLENILSHDYRMLKIFDVIESVADARASILITGENGTGKSLIARAIHRRSNRSEHPFVEVACGALPESLLESELFGHVAGAFTGASANKIGKFKLADRGTLFLDEIGTATAALQVKLLRVLQELQFEQVGGTVTETVDTRVILATNEDLAAAVHEGRFRQDLYFRINVINIEIPPLRERAGDIPLLVDYFLRKASAESGRSIEGFDRGALELLQQYAWPGNVRELENIVERAVLLGRGSVLTPEDLPPQVVTGSPVFSGPISPPWSSIRSVPRPSGPSSDSHGNVRRNEPLASHRSNVSGGGGIVSLRDALEAPERQIILDSLRRNQWNRIATADELQINRTTLYKKMKRLGLDDPRLQFQDM